MRTRLTIFLIVGVALLVGVLFARQRYLAIDLPRGDYLPRKIRVLTYATFAGASGPGKDLVRMFQQEQRGEKFATQVEMVTAGDAGLLLERLKVAEAGTPFDVVIGVDQMALRQAEENFKWKPLFFGKSGRHPQLSEYNSEFFVPFDWSPMGFIYKKGEFKAPENMQEMLDSAYRKQFALQDPHSSSPGLQFFQWVRATQGPKTVDYLRKFKENVNSVSPSWAFSYGLFQKEQTRFVFSYLTSLAFHWGFENKRDYRIVTMTEGHPVQVEYVAIPASCRECEIAEKFVALMLKPEAQKIIMEKNFMFPAINGLEEGTIFGELPRLKTIRVETGKDLSEWDQVFKN